MQNITYLKRSLKTLESYDHATRKRIIEAIDKIPQYPPLYRLRIEKLELFITLKIVVSLL